MSAAQMLLRTLKKKRNKAFKALCIIDSFII